METQNNVETLRNALFAEIQELQKPGVNLELAIKRATAVANLGGVIVNSAKIEVDAMKVIKSYDSTFLKKQIGNGDK